MLNVRLSPLLAGGGPFASYLTSFSPDSFICSMRIIKHLLCRIVVKIKLKKGWKVVYPSTQNLVIIAYYVVSF